MSESDLESDVAQIPEDLPPVQPPSAGFIIQLFVVPGVIVAAIVGVWLLFGKLATSENDWRGLVAELQHQNKHRRGRAELGLAQMLSSDLKLGDQGQHLSTNRELAQALSETLTNDLKRGTAASEDAEYQAYLASALGLFDLPDLVFSTLQLALQPQFDPKIRKTAIESIAVLTDRMSTSGAGAPSDIFLPVLMTVATDEDPVMRQLCAFTLGLFPQPAAQERLEILLSDTDPNTRVNAAIGLARQGNLQGFSVLQSSLEAAVADIPRGSTEEAKNEEYAQFLLAKNCLAAIERLASKLAPEQKSQLLPLLTSIASKHREPLIRAAAQSASSALETPAVTPR